MRRWGWQGRDPVAEGIVDFLVYDGEDIDDRYADWIMAATANADSDLVQSAWSLGRARVSRSIAAGVLYVREQRGREIVSPPVPQRRPLGERESGRPGGSVIVHTVPLDDNTRCCRAPRNVREPPSGVPTSHFESLECDQPCGCASLKKNKKGRRDMASPSIEWSTSTGFWEDGPLLWHCIPGFVGTTLPLTLCRTTHPHFLESMRLFGVPENHPSRLERHGLAGFIGQEWYIVLHSHSPLGVSRYQLLCAGNTKLALGLVSGSMIPTLVPTDNGIDTWNILPAYPFGWDFVHANTGHRLEVGDAMGTSVSLSPALNGWTHWDILRFGEAPRPHFWLPVSFANPMVPDEAAMRVYPVNTGPVEAVIYGNATSTRTSTHPTAKDANLQSCITECEKQSCAFFSLNNENKCTVYGNDWTLDNQITKTQALVGPAGKPVHHLLWERRLVRGGPQ